jgi:hypothetical protein
VEVTRRSDIKRYLRGNELTDIQCPGCHYNRYVYRNKVTGKLWCSCFPSLQPSKTKPSRADVQEPAVMNPLKTEHALDWSKTAQEIEDQFQAGMIERDRYREALKRIAHIHDHPSLKHPCNCMTCSAVNSALNP